MTRSYTFFSDLVLIEEPATPPVIPPTTGEAVNRLIVIAFPTDILPVLTAKADIAIGAAAPIITPADARRDCDLVTSVILFSPIGVDLIFLIYLV